MPNTKIEAPCGGILLNSDQFEVDSETCVISIIGGGDYPPGEGPANDATVSGRVNQILSA